MKKYDRCCECDKLLPIIKTKRKYGTLCKSCVIAKLLSMHNNKSDFVPMPDVHTEERFEDDPRALKEIEYGKVYKTSTHVFSRNILDDIG
tara:strand:- start:1233 stop:1502 length:270 start_codon:yes stop_codon:yes gene_type:complete